MANKKNKNKNNNRRQQQQQSKNFKQNNKQNQRKSSEQSDLDDNVDFISTKMSSVSLLNPLKAFMSLNQDNPVYLNEQPSGLPNLGNTCYFNSVMQVMGQSYIIHHMLKERCQEDFIWNAKTFYWKEKSQLFASESIHLKLPPPNSMILNFLQLQQQIFQRKSTSPRALLTDVQREKHQFEGFAQQDAHELLITVLDALKKAEMARQQKSLIDGLKIEAKNPTDEDRQKAQRYKITAKHTIVDAIFGGQLLSIVHCMTCDYRSFRFEPFIDLALSLECSDAKQSYNNLIKVPLKSANNNNNNKKNNKNNKKKQYDTSDDEDDESAVVPEIPQQTLEDDNSSSKVDRKKIRQEKKAARKKERQERKRMRLQKIQEAAQESSKKSSYGQDDDDEKQQLINNQKSSDEDSDNNDEEDNNEKTEIKNEVKEETEEEKPKINGNLSSDTEIKNEEMKPIQITAKAEFSSSSDEEEDDESSSITETTETSDSSVVNRINDDFRYKFYLFAHQRMSRTDDDYQNLDLGALLRNFIKEEVLDGSNKYLCENCSKLNNGQKIYSKAVRCQLIALPPPVLILQLKRFEAYGFNRRVASMQKLNTKISFPEKLYLSPYTSRIYEYFSRFYEPECDPDDISHLNEYRLEYTLYGVVIHSGSLRFGHYMAYVCVRTGSFDGRTIKRFLHLKPFVSNIEHILQVVHEDLIKNGTSECNQDNKEKTNDDNNLTENHINNLDNQDQKSKPELEDNEDDSSSNTTNKRKWYFISDSSVSSTTIENVLKDCTSPYMLFYERTN